MNLKLFLLLIAFIGGAYGVNCNSRVFYPRTSTPSDPNKTPITPDIFLPYKTFSRKRIFFGKDASGKPCYKPVWKHEDENPEFNNITLVAFHKTAYSKMRFSDQFETLGTYSNDTASRELLRSVYPRWYQIGESGGAVWCPEQNAIIGGTQDPEICDRFAQYLKEEKENKQSGRSKLNKIAPFGLYGTISSLTSTDETKSEEK